MVTGMRIRNILVDQSKIFNIKGSNVEGKDVTLDAKENLLKLLYLISYFCYNYIIALQLKVAKSAQENLQVLAEDALGQIEQKRYDTALLAEGVTDIYKYGIAFYKKNVEIVVK